MGRAPMQEHLHHRGGKTGKTSYEIAILLPEPMLLPGHAFTTAFENLESVQRDMLPLFGPGFLPIR